MRQCKILLHEKLILVLFFSFHCVHRWLGYWLVTIAQSKLAKILIKWTSISTSQQRQSSGCNQLWRVMYQRVEGCTHSLSWEISWFCTEVHQISETCSATNFTTTFTSWPQVSVIFRWQHLCNPKQQDLCCCQTDTQSMPSPSNSFVGSSLFFSTVKQIIPRGPIETSQHGKYVFV